MVAAASGSDSRTQKWEQIWRREEARATAALKNSGEDAFCLIAPLPLACSRRIFGQGLVVATPSAAVTRVDNGSSAAVGRSGESLSARRQLHAFSLSLGLALPFGRDEDEQQLTARHGGWTAARSFSDSDADGISQS
ncbi:uncharacterized protein DS421_14g462250 [Arachis hypogaea]|nr:uncharacterized protein DS421_14g462250 [Arachis hypogaea]